MRTHTIDVDSVDDEPPRHVWIPPGNDPQSKNADNFATIGFDSSSGTTRHVRAVFGRIECRGSPGT